MKFYTEISSAPNDWGPAINHVQYSCTSCLQATGSPLADAAPGKALPLDWGLYSQRPRRAAVCTVMSGRRLVSGPFDVAAGGAALLKLTEDASQPGAKISAYPSLVIPLC